MASDSVEMYLVTIAMSREGEQPVPLSLLAQELSISPVSVNEMCRKLMERGLVDYRPYEGVTLTSEGSTLACQVLCRRRLWEVFLVERLGLGAKEAEAMADQLEHATSDRLIERLAAFLEYPTLSPQNQPIPCTYGDLAERPVRPLTTLAAGQRGQVVNVVAGEEVKDFLRAQGVLPGATLHVMAVAAEGSLLVEIKEQQLSLSRAVAAYVDITPVEGEDLPEILPKPASDKETIETKPRQGLEKERKMSTQVSQTTLDQLPIGGQGVVVRIGGEKATRRRLLDMGLVTGETVTIKAVAPLGDPLELLIKGYQLSVRKDEARQIVVEVGHAIRT
jgi:DtxR family Mn-dependent transcriptional regulator